MVRFFITLYHFLNRHKFLLYASLLAWIGIMTYCATQVKFEELVKIMTEADLILLDNPGYKKGF